MKSTSTERFESVLPLSLKAIVSDLLVLYKVLLGKFFKNSKGI